MRGNGDSLWMIMDEKSAVGVGGGGFGGSVGEGASPGLRRSSRLSTQSSSAHVNENVRTDLL